MEKIRIGVVGVGNCASSLIQGIEYYHEKNKHEPIGLMHPLIGDYRPSDIEVVSAFDIDKRKVGKDVSQAIFSLPNCTTIFYKDIPKTNTKVTMGRVLDGVADHMADFSNDEKFLVSSHPESSKEEVVKILKESRTEILLNYLPVGSQKATEFYAECALEANVAFINNMPIFIASHPEWAERFKEKNLPIIGDDIKAQCGATIT